MKLVLSFLGVALAMSAAAVTFHRSFRNGYPAEWNVTKEQANGAMRVGDQSVHLGSPQTKKSNQIAGIVTRVANGDTIWVLEDGIRYKIRLHRIDAPEPKQEFGAESTAYLKSLIAGKVVTVEKLGTDQYGGILGIVYLGGDDVNLRLVKEGMAWHSYQDKTSAYIEAQKAAREAKRGLWSADKPVNPYLWRRTHR